MHRSHHLLDLAYSWWKPSWLLSSLCRCTICIAYILSLHAWDTCLWSAIERRCLQYHLSGWSWWLHPQFLRPPPSSEHSFQSVVRTSVRCFPDTRTPPARQKVVANLSALSHVILIIIEECYPNYSGWLRKPVGTWGNQCTLLVCVAHSIPRGIFSHYSITLTLIS